MKLKFWSSAFVYLRKVLASSVGVVILTFPSREDFNLGEKDVAFSQDEPSAHWTKEGFKFVYTFRAEKGVTKNKQNPPVPDYFPQLIAWEGVMTVNGLAVPHPTMWESIATNDVVDAEDFFSDIGPISVQQATPVKKRRLE